MTTTIDSPQTTVARRPSGPPRAQLYAAISINMRERAKKEENGPRGPRNPLKRLDPAKEIQGFPLIYFGRAWLDSARALLNFGLAGENQIAVIPCPALGCGRKDMP
jgi:hypothetical protein